MPRLDELRPMERLVLKLEDAGMGREEIARRTRRSPGFIDRVSEFARLGVTRTPSNVDQPLRPIERRVRWWRDQGAEHEEIARRFRTSEDRIRRIEHFTHLKEELNQPAE